MSTAIRRAAIATALAVCASAAAHAQSSRIEWVRAELRGPLEHARADFAPAGRLAIECALSQGERLELELPIPTSGSSHNVRDLERAVRDVAPATGEVRWLGPSESDREARWQALPAGLRARPRPALSDARRAAPWSVLFVLGAAFAIGMRMRGRPFVALAVAAAGGGATWMLVRAQLSREPRSLRIFECDGAQGIWSRLLGSRERLLLPDDTLIVDSEPRDAALTAHVDLAPGREPAFSVEAPATALWACSDFDAGPRRVSRILNSWSALDQVWSRDEAGLWKWRGTWELGQALPEATAAAEGEHALPGWMNPALPQGVGVLVARIRAGGFGTADGAEAWIRVVGF